MKTAAAFNTVFNAAMAAASMDHQKLWAVLFFSLMSLASTMLCSALIVADAIERKKSA